MRVIARRERPHPGAQLRPTDTDGWRITFFATNPKGGRIAELKVQHRMRARAEDRIRGLKTPGYGTCRCTTSPPTRSGSSWCNSPLTSWPQHLALTSTAARTWEPKRLRPRLLNIAGRIREERPP